MKINKNALIHIVLGHSYLVYFATFVIGFLVDTKWSFRFNAPFLMPIGFILLFVGPALIVWAQYTSHELAIKQVVTKKEIFSHDFFRGPYVFSRSPTHVGLFLMIVGLGLLFNSVSIVGTTVLAFILTKIFFLSKEESLLEEKYGSEYQSYKDKVKL